LLVRVSAGPSRVELVSDCSVLRAHPEVLFLKERLIVVDVLNDAIKFLRLSCTDVSALALRYFVLKCNHALGLVSYNDLLLVKLDFFSSAKSLGVYKLVSKIFDLRDHCLVLFVDRSFLPS